jgi:hypothetical protein
MERQFEYRITYRKENCVGLNKHYYMAESAEQALEFQVEMIHHRHWNIDILKIEKMCPWSNLWIDESEILNNIIYG